MEKHDKVDPRGFNVSPEQLAHDLAIVKLSNMQGIEKMLSREVYDAYLNFLDEMKTEIESRTRYDSAFSK